MSFLHPRISGWYYLRSIVSLCRAKIGRSNIVKSHLHTKSWGDCGYGCGYCPPSATTRMYCIYTNMYLLLKSLTSLIYIYTHTHIILCTNLWIWKGTSDYYWGQYILLLKISSEFITWPYKRVAWMYVCILLERWLKEIHFLHTIEGLIFFENNISTQDFFYNCVVAHDIQLL